MACSTLPLVGSLGKGAPSLWVGHGRMLKKGAGPAVFQLDGAQMRPAGITVEIMQPLVGAPRVEPDPPCALAGTQVDRPAKQQLPQALTGVFAGSGQFGHVARWFCEFLGGPEVGVPVGGDGDGGNRGSVLADQVHLAAFDDRRDPLDGESGGPLADALGGQPGRHTVQQRQYLGQVIGDGEVNGPHAVSPSLTKTPRALRISDMPSPRTLYDVI